MAQTSAAIIDRSANFPFRELERVGTRPIFIYIYIYTTLCGPIAQVCQWIATIVGGSTNRETPLSKRRQTHNNRSTPFFTILHHSPPAPFARIYCFGDEEWKHDTINQLI